jgi:Ran GTPase-activating protein (RanGAP) involved in mRNA processing and transport
LDAAAAVLLARALAAAVNLETLDISQNKCGDNGAVAICHALKGNTRLLKLNLRQNEIGARGGKEIGDLLACPGLRLKKLNVSWNSIRGYGSSALCRAVGANVYLQRLDISWNIVGEESALQLGDALARNKSMFYLNLEHCGINDVSAVSCALRLLCAYTLSHTWPTKTHHITPLSLLNSPPKVLIAYGLRRNASIIDINLNTNPIGRNGAQVIRGLGF